MDGSLLAMVGARIITSAKDCLDVEVFSNIGNFISYNGYPDEDLIANTVTMDENGNFYELSVVDQAISYRISALDPGELLEQKLRIFEYIIAQNSNNYENIIINFEWLINEIIKIRGVTY